MEAAPPPNHQHPPPQARGGGGGKERSGGDKEANGGELRLTLTPLFCLTAGICLYAGAARLPPSTGKCATSTSRQTAARDVHEEEEEGGEEKKKKKRSLLLRRNPGAVCVYLAAVAAAAAALRGRKSAAPHWRDAICSRLPCCTAALRGRAQLAHRRWRPLLPKRYGRTAFSLCGSAHLTRASSAPPITQKLCKS